MGQRPNALSPRVEMILDLRLSVCEAIAMTPWGAGHVTICGEEVPSVHTPSYSQRARLPVGVGDVDWFVHDSDAMQTHLVELTRVELFQNEAGDFGVWFG